MSSAATLNVKAASPAARAIRHADDGIGKWLKDLVTGEGSSPAHIIVTGILGVVPGVGQAFDARDMILCIIQIARTPTAVFIWVELVITLIGCIPLVGDALKVGFKLMKQGHNFGRVLEGVSPKLRGNVEKFMRNIDWGMLTRETKELFDRAISAFSDGLDSWVVKSLAGRQQVTQIVDQLKAVQRQGPKMIDEAFVELKQLHAKMMRHDLPDTTAALNATTAKAAKQETQQAAGTAAKSRKVEPPTIPAKTKKDSTQNHTTPDRTKSNTKKKAQPKKQKWHTGIPAEHITDYYVKKKHANFKKANNSGKLIEEHHLPHNGIDHLWSNKSHITQPFVVGETKSSIFDSFKLMAALPADLREKFDTLKAEEAANPTANNDKPNIFHSEGRDQHANQKVKIGSEQNDEDAIKRGVNRPNEETGLRTQMSHAWIENALPNEKLTAAGRELTSLMRRHQRERLLNPNARFPYQRWISLVTGRQIHKHAKSGGSCHEIQVVLDLPDNILER